MYEISIRQHFDAAHYLREYAGKCENLHGHRFQIIASVQTKELNEIGLGYDFTELKKLLDIILNRFDHYCLNDISPFDTINPSSENIATTIYKELKDSIERKDITVSNVQVYESPDSWITYIPEDTS